MQQEGMQNNIPDGARNAAGRQVEQYTWLNKECSRKACRTIYLTEQGMQQEGMQNIIPYRARNAAGKDAEQYTWLSKEYSRKGCRTLYLTEKECNRKACKTLYLTEKECSRKACRTIKELKLRILQKGMHRNLPDWRLRMLREGMLVCRAWWKDWFDTNQFHPHGLKPKWII